jgi:DNA repair exonuclease SbcCD ATPase subunit
MRDLTPAGRDESRIGKIEDLIATPERRVKKSGENAVVVRSSGKIESDWIIEKFDPETGVASVSKRDKEGKLLMKEIPRKDFLAVNFPRSDEMFYTLERGREKGLGKAMSKESEKDLQRIAEAKKAFAGGDIGPMRNYFAEQMRVLEKRYKEEDNLQRKDREKAVKAIGKIEKDLAKVERNRLESRGSERDADDLTIIHLREDLQDAKTRFEDASRRLEGGHDDLNNLREFVAILDQEFDKRSARAA